MAINQDPNNKPRPNSKGQPEPEDHLVGKQEVP